MTAKINNHYNSLFPPNYMESISESEDSVDPVFDDLDDY